MTRFCVAVAAMLLAIAPALALDGQPTHLAQTALRHVRLEQRGEKEGEAWNRQQLQRIDLRTTSDTRAPAAARGRRRHPDHSADARPRQHSADAALPERNTTELIAATEVILVTRESNAAEIEALRTRCTACQHLDGSGWDVLPDLRLDQAAALPGTLEANGGLQTFTIGERLTLHVRHRQKYVDVPVTDSHAFVFTNRSAMGVRAHTLREFVAELERIDIQQADPYLRRGDFARWIGDVFGDHALARELQRGQRRYVLAKYDDVLDEIIAAIRSRYDLAKHNEDLTATGTLQR
jgi:hypothetical protein